MRGHTNYICFFIFHITALLLDSQDLTSHKRILNGKIEHFLFPCLLQTTITKTIVIPPLAFSLSASRYIQQHNLLQLTFWKKFYFLLPFIALTRPWTFRHLLPHIHRLKKKKKKQLTVLFKIFPVLHSSPNSWVILHFTFDIGLLNILLFLSVYLHYHGRTTYCGILQHYK